MNLSRFIPITFLALSLSSCQLPLKIQRQEIENRLTIIEDSSLGEEHYHPILKFKNTNRREVIYHKKRVFDNLSRNQIKRINNLLDLLSQENVRNEVGRQLEADLRDKYAEHGGIVSLEKENNFFPFESALTRDLKRCDLSDEKLQAMGNSFYKLPKIAHGLPHLATYHCHAIEEDNSRCAGPSIGFSVLSDLTLTRDLGCSITEMLTRGEAHDLVLTKLKGNKFNVCYYGGEKDKKDKLKLTIIGLGDYTYSNSIDERTHQDQSSH